MGREIRMVPPNWQSPPCENGREGPQPMHDTSWESIVREWHIQYKAWQNETHESYEDGMEFWEWNPPPKREYYRPWKDEEAIWYQCWETISEGTPVTPAFETKDELIEYLALKGDYWDQLREMEKNPGPFAMKGGPWGWKRAIAFVAEGHVSTMMLMVSDKGAEIYDSKDIALKMQERKDVRGI